MVATLLRGDNIEKGTCLVRMKHMRKKQKTETFCRENLILKVFILV